MGDLTTNFSRNEFHCKHCGLILMNMDLVFALQQLRNLVNVKITVNSGYRCKKHPESLKRSGSQHALGNAADIVIEGFDWKEMYKYARQIPEFENGGIGVYPENNFIHVDVRGKKARWAYVGEEYVAIETVLSPCELE